MAKRARRGANSRLGELEDKYAAVVKERDQLKRVAAGAQAAADVRIKDELNNQMIAEKRYRRQLRDADQSVSRAEDAATHATNLSTHERGLLEKRMEKLKAEQGRATSKLEAQLEAALVARDKQKQMGRVSTARRPRRWWTPSATG